MKNQIKPLLLLYLFVATLYLTGCKDDEVEGPPTGVNVATNATHGSILTDSNGYSLYFFVTDTKGESTCNGGCKQAWPVFYVESPVAGTGLSSADFGVITRADGDKQTTYKGFPLYYYSPTNDGNLEAKGETKGDAVGNVWYLAKPNHTIMIAQAQLIGHDAKNYTSTYVEGQEVTTYFVDGKGRTLYRFTKDTKNKNNFTAADLSNNATWPIYYAALGDLPSNVNKADFGEITVAGQKQLTYKGWPLYYFGQDTKRGDNKGISYPKAAVWPIVNTTTATAP